MPPIPPDDPLFASDELDDEAIVTATLLDPEILRHLTRPYANRPRREEVGEEGLDILLRSQDPKSPKHALRMSKDSFLRLVEWLKEHTTRRPSREISTHQKVAIFLQIVGRGHGYRDASRVWGHSLDTISR